jgi:hypothetical protein
MTDKTFEKFDSGYFKHLDSAPDYTSLLDGIYADHNVRQRFKYWQASRTAALEEAATWIAVSERLPEKSCECLAYYPPHRIADLGITTDEFNAKTGTFWYGGSGMEPTHSTCFSKSRWNWPHCAGTWQACTRNTAPA